MKFRRFIIKKNNWHITNITARPSCCDLSEISKRNDLPEDCVITVVCIQQRARKQMLWKINSFSVPGSPLLKYKAEFAPMLIQMARMGQSLTPSQSVSFTNSMIFGMKVKRDLMVWKIFFFA